MKKTKLSVEIHTTGDANEGILRMIANHNAGLTTVDLLMIRMFCYSRFAQYPTITPVFETMQADNVLEIYECTGNEKKHTLTITEKEIFELDELPPVQVTEESLKNQEPRDTGTAWQSGFKNDRSTLETTHY